jgi:phage terminase large subunit GpA-like protein
MQLEVLARCAPATEAVFDTLAAALRPAPKLRVSEWAEQHRVVSAESGSRYSGNWHNDRAPHLVEVMDALGPDDPAEDVIFVASAQVGKSEVGVNFFGFVVAQDPGPMILVLPSYDESIKYVRTKLQPAVDESPVLKARVLEATNRAERGSTASYKRFRGGFAQITFAGSSKGLQMLSAKYTVGDEVSEWPAVAGERGDPVEQLKARTKIYERDRKRFWASTPALLGTCRITADYDLSDKRRRYVPCPHCGAYQVLSFDRMKWESETWPHRAWFECKANGCVIEHVDKPEMMAAGVWIATAVDEPPPEIIEPENIGQWRGLKPTGRRRGFHIWQAYTLFSTWDSIVAEYLAAKGRHEKMKAFTQQVLGEAWEDRGDAPEAEKLYMARVPQIAKGRPPAGPVVLTGATDVQGNRLEWAVWGWSEGMTRWLIDWGVIKGDPYDQAVWHEHSQMMQAARYRIGGGREIDVDAWAIDTGYASPMVYSYTRGRPRVFGIDGRREGRTDPFIGSPRKVDIRWNGKVVPKGAVFWPVGTFGLKSDHYSSIRRTIAGRLEDGSWVPGSMILPGDIDLAYAEQLTSEHLAEVEAKSGVLEKRWMKLSGRPNEALDIACYARAMAYHLKLDRLTPAEWAQLRLERLGDGTEAAQGDLFEVVVAPATPPAAAPIPKERRKESPSPRDAGLGDANSWLGPVRKGWV